MASSSALLLLLRPFRTLLVSSVAKMSSAATTASVSGGGGPVEKRMEEKLKKAFSPTHLQILNESHMHNVPRGSETHFKVLVVSDAFADQNLISRHRAVNEALGNELSVGGVHALSIVAKTPKQYEEMAAKDLEQSPACKGGFGK